LNYFVFYILTLFSVSDTLKQDSISLPEIKISESIIHGISKPDAQLVNEEVPNKSRHSLVDLLEGEANIYLRNYGPGTVATVSIRGSAPSQTQLSWHDMPIVSPTLGLSDLSLIHSYLFNNIEVYKGNESAEYGNGAIGGRLNLLNGAASTNQQELNLSVARGSFGRFETGLEFSSKFRNLSFTTTGSYLQAKNDYKIDLGPSFQKNQTHADFKSLNVIQSVNYDLSERSKLNLNFWLIDNDRNIPPVIVQTQSASAQQDQSLRIVGSYEFLGANWQTTLSAGYVKEHQDYQDSLINLFTVNSFDQYYTQGSFSQVFGAFSYSIRTGFIHHTAETGNYENGINQSRFTNALKLNWQGKKYLLEFVSRSIIVDEEYERSVNKLGLSYLASNSLSINFEIGQLFRLPTLNDLYWRPGGNENLRSENGFDTTLGFKFSRQKNERSINLSLDFFYRDVNDWILWAIDSNSGLWGVTNLGRVVTQGLDLSSQLNFSLSQFDLKLNAQLQYLSSINKEPISFPNIAEEQQLFYTPRLSTSHRVSIDFERLTTFFSFAWQDESLGINEQIESFTIINSGVNYKLKLNSVDAKLYLHLNNLLNKNYFIIERRPMPGFNTLLGISITI